MKFYNENSNLNVLKLLQIFYFNHYDPFLHCLLRVRRSILVPERVLGGRKLRSRVVWRSFQGKHNVYATTVRGNQQIFRHLHSIFLMNSLWPPLFYYYPLLTPLYVTSGFINVWEGVKFIWTVVRPPVLLNDHLEHGRPLRGITIKFQGHLKGCRTGKHIRF